MYANFEINRYKIDKFRKHAKIVCFILRQMTQNSGFNSLMTMQSFTKICNVLMGDMDVVKVLKNALCFIMGYFVAMETYVTFIS